MSKQTNNGCWVWIIFILIVSYFFGKIGSVENEPTNKYVTEVEFENDYQKAKYELSEGNPEEAIDLINNVIQLDSTNSEYFAFKAEALYNNADFKLSDSAYKHAIDIEKSELIKDELIRKAIFLYNNRLDVFDIDAYLNIQNELFNNDKKNRIRVVRFQASFLSTNNRKTLALEKFMLLHKIIGSELENIKAIANIYMEIKKKDSAISWYKKGLNIAPDDLFINKQLGLYYHKKKWNKTAKKYLKKAAELGDSESCDIYRDITAATKYSYYSRCCDGSTSYSTGRGACSHHGGVCGTIREPYKYYTVNCN